MSGYPGRSPSPAAFPERVGRYELLVPIASGGMATVYLARVCGLGGFERQVAVKLTHAHLRDEQSFATDLLEEGKIAAQITHPNVVPVLEVGDDALGLYLVMDYVEGDSLAGLRRAAASRGEQMPIEIGLRILVDALAGLHAAHELRGRDGRPIGLVHRDFSPQNILVGLDGLARLTDFGVAKAATRASHTSTGIVKGKVAYMAPEQARGDELDRRCDVWAAGIIGWELATGERLYAHENDVSTLLRIVTEEPPRVRGRIPTLAPELDEAIAGALKLDRQARCPTAAALAARLDAASVAMGCVASRADVADFVERFALDKIDERRRRVADELRRRSEAQPTPSSLVEAPEPAPAPPSRSLGSHAADGTRTDTVSTRDAAARPPVLQRPRVIAAIAAGALAAAGVGFTVARAASRLVTAPSPTAAAAATSGPESAQAPTPSASASASMAPVPVAAPAATHASGTPPADTAPASHATATPAATAPQRPAAKPVRKLAPSPYE